MSTQGYITGGTAQVGTHPGIPDELKGWTQWVTWNYGPPRPDGKRSKVLHIPGTRRKASTTDSATWGTYAEALADLQAGRADGVGFVFTPDDPYTGIDLDGCRDPETGAVEPWAQELIERFSSYTEVSPSGTGLHIIGRGVKPGTDCRSGEQIECYDERRFFTMTGHVAPGYAAVRNFQRELTSWYREVWPVEPVRTPEPVVIPAAAPDELDAEEIVAHLSDHPDKGERFRDLYAGGLGGFPSGSEARFALMGMCNPYTTDAGTVETVVRASGQWSEKCEARPELVRREIQKSIKRYNGPRYSRRRALEPPPESLGSSEPVDTGPIDDLPCDEVRAQLRRAQAQIARQAQMLRDERELRHGIERILASTELQLGQRVTAIGVCLEVADQQRRGRRPGEHGHRALASWIAKRTGQAAKTVNGHLGQLDRAGVIERNVVTELIPADMIDHETGEILKADTPRKIGYVRTEPAAIVTNITEYRRQAEDRRHGGKRDLLPRCEKHPEAGTITHTVVECAECGDIVHQGRTVQTPEEIAASWQEAELQPTGTEGAPPQTPPLAVVSPVTHDADSGDITDDQPVSGPARTCWECHQALDIGRHTLCPDCAAKHRRERAQADRARRAGTRTCAQCGEPTATPEARYCPAHGGGASITEPTSASWAAS